MSGYFSASQFHPRQICCQTQFLNAYSCPTLEMWFSGLSTVCHRGSRKILYLSWVKLRRLPFLWVPVNVHLLVPSVFFLFWLLSPSSLGSHPTHAQLHLQSKTSGKFWNTSMSRSLFLTLLQIPVTSLSPNAISFSSLQLGLSVQSENTSRHRTQGHRGPHPICLPFY